MPSVRRRWTSAEVRALMDESRAWPRYELLDGELLVTPAPNTTHQQMVLEFVRVLADHLEAEPIGLVFASPADLELREDTITQPDVFVVPQATWIAGDQLAWTDVKRLLLAVEIISPSSVRVDRVTKRDFYLENNVDEYWVIDVDARIVERWQPASERPEVIRDTLTWEPGTRRMEVDLPALFSRIAAKLRMFHQAAP